MAKLIRRVRSHMVVRRYEAILLGSVLFLTGAVIPSSWEPPVKILPRPVVVLPPQRPWIALTFDDGPHPVLTQKLLDVLKQENVPATFFVVGKMADRYPQLLQEIAKTGHEIANHTYNHPRLTKLEDGAVLNELAQTRSVIRRLTGRDTHLFRPPGGDYNRDTVRATADAGYKMILWSVLTRDVQGASPKLIESRILKGAEDNGIVLLHSGVPNTLRILPSVITKLRARGYNFVTVSTLLGLPGQEHYAPSERPLMQTVADPLHDPATRVQ